MEEKVKDETIVFPLQELETFMGAHAGIVDYCNRQEDYEKMTVLGKLFASAPKNRYAELYESPIEADRALARAFKMACPQLNRYVVGDMYPDQFQVITDLQSFSRSGEFQMHVVVNEKSRFTGFQTVYEDFIDVQASGSLSNPKVVDRKRSQKCAEVIEMVTSESDEVSKRLAEMLASVCSKSSKGEYPDVAKVFHARLLYDKVVSANEVLCQLETWEPLPLRLAEILDKVPDGVRSYYELKDRRAQIMERFQNGSIPVTDKNCQAYSNALMNGSLSADLILKDVRKIVHKDVNKLSGGHREIPSLEKLAHYCSEAERTKKNKFMGRSDFRELASQFGYERDEIEHFIHNDNIPRSFAGYGGYPADPFNYIPIDECLRGNTTFEGFGHDVLGHVDIRVSDFDEVVKDMIEENLTQFMRSGDYLSLSEGDRYYAFHRCFVKNCIEFESNIYQMEGVLDRFPNSRYNPVLGDIEYVRETSYQDSVVYPLLMDYNVALMKSRAEEFLSDSRFVQLRNGSNENFYLAKCIDAVLSDANNPESDHKLVTDFLKEFKIWNVKDNDFLAICMDRVQKTNANSSRKCAYDFYMNVVKPELASMKARSVGEKKEKNNQIKIG